MSDKRGPLPGALNVWELMLSPQWGMDMAGQKSHRCHIKIREHIIRMMLNHLLVLIQINSSVTSSRNLKSNLNLYSGISGTHCFKFLLYIFSCPLNRPFSALSAPGNCHSTHCF